LREKEKALKAVKKTEYVFNFAADMGGIGYLTETRAKVMKNNVLINVNLLEASLKNKVRRFFFPSSACIYPIYKQKNVKNLGLKESDAYPADCDNEYGWEKLFSERLCQNYYKDLGLETRIARYHNVYGPGVAWHGGREKSIAALCRKIAQAKNNDQIVVWGDGKQSRSYTYIEDCIKGTYKLTMSKIRIPLNIGSNQLITINQLVKIIAKIANKKIKKKHDLSKPQGVRGRNSDNRLTKKLLRWEPEIKLEKGLVPIYNWIEKQVQKNLIKMLPSY
jgi:nucleoside-diphosphate-sugar epimerase